jgi:hypothetical protein
VPEALSATEVGEMIGEHAKHSGRISVLEAVLLSVVTIVVAWAGFSAAKWETESSLDLTSAAVTHTKANRYFELALAARAPALVAADEARSRRLDAAGDVYFKHGEKAAFTADDYVRVTLILASVLFLVGISTQFPFQRLRYGLIGVGVVMLLIAAGEILSLPGPP